MSDARLVDMGEGCFELSGVLSFKTVPQLYQEGAARFGNHRELRIDLNGVSRSDSAGLALLIEWMRLSRQSQCHITFLNVPQQMLAIARVSSLDTILPMTRNR